MLTNLFKAIFSMPEYNPRKVVVPLPQDCRVKLNRKALVKEFEKEKTPSVVVNKQGKNEVFKQTESGFDMEIIGNTASSVTVKTGTIQRVEFLTDWDKMLIAHANSQREKGKKLDPLKAARVKVKWATIRNGKYLTNKIIAHEIGETGLGERNVSEYTSLMSQALEIQQKEQKAG